MQYEVVDSNLLEGNYFGGRKSVVDEVIDFIFFQFNFR